MRKSPALVLTILASLFAASIAACVVTTPPANPPPQGPPVVAAPGTACAAAECGPAMAMPNGKCDDGSLSGPTGRCLRQADGRCGWEVRSCPPAAAACARAGCSGTLCVDANHDVDVFTTCDVRPEYECYAAATCARQANGACGWTQTTALSQCLSSKSGKQ